MNNRIIANVNSRKDRLNLINSRITGISSRILSLYGTKDLIRVVSPAHFPKISTSDCAKNHPHQSIFYDRKEIKTLGEEINDGAEMREQELPQRVMPELSSIKLKKKLYNNRLMNKPGDLQQVISGATKDINDISNLLLSFNRYRSDTVGSLKQCAQGICESKAATAVPGVENPAQGILGRMPETITSVAELMVFDSDINVYEDTQVNVSNQQVVFNIGGRATKIVSK